MSNESKAWTLTDGTQQVVFQPYNNSYTTLTSPTSPGTINGIRFDSPAHKVVLTTESARTTWNELRESGWEAQN
jgi:hypothetical protein